MICKCHQSLNRLNFLKYYYLTTYTLQHWKNNPIFYSIISKQKNALFSSIPSSSPDLKFIPKTRIPESNPFSSKFKSDIHDKTNGEVFNLTSGRGNLGATNEERVDLLSDNPNREESDMNERSIGLSYHAWELKMKEVPLAKIKKLEELKAANELNPAHVNRDVFSIVTDLDVLSSAFISMYCRYGSVEDAKILLEKKAKAWLFKVISRLNAGLYTFPQPRQLEPKAMMAPKYDGSLEHVPIWWHKTMVEAIRMILEAIFEPAFSRTSHGYRPGRGCYTALKQVKYDFGGVSYFIVGDLSKCLESYDFSQLQMLINERITDKKFLALLNKTIISGFLDMSKVSFKHVGISQKTFISPILCNVYMTAMDQWMEDLMRCIDASGSSSVQNQAYMTSTLGIQQVLSNRDKVSTNRIKNVKSWKSATFKSLKYVRYGCNFLIGLDCNDMDAEQFELDLIKFIKLDLKLDYKNFKFNRAASTTPDKEYVVFLGTEIYVAPLISSPGLDASNPLVGQLPQRPRLCVPARYLLSKLEEGGFTDVQRKKPKFNGKVVHWECHEIVKYFDITTKMFYLYYTFADNYHCLTLLHDILRQSCAFTLARKLSLKRMWHVHKRIGKDMVIRDAEGNILASFRRPTFVKPSNPFLGKDVNPYLRLEKPAKPKFPPVKIVETLVEPKFPINRFKNDKIPVLQNDLL